MHDFSRPVDLIDEVGYKLAFLHDVFTQPIASDQTPYLSNAGSQGLSLFLFEMKEILFKSTDAIIEQQKRERKQTWEN